MPGVRRSPAALLPLALVIGLLGVAAPARASLILALDLPTMVGRADRIAVVDVLSIKSAWNDRHDRISTEIGLSVVDCWKGDLRPGTRLTVLQPGGTVDDITMTVDGMPRFVPGERTLVFLRGAGDRAAVVGMAQGKRPVRHDASTGRWMVRAPDRAGADFVRTRTMSDPPVLDARERPLDEIRSQVRALVAPRVITR